MLRWTLALVAAGILAAGPALSQHTGDGISPADPESPVGTAGGVILYFVNGRTLEEASASGDTFNPFGIDGEGLLYNIGSFFITAEYAGEPVHEGELSIYPQFGTPYGGFEASASTPGIIPFAFLKVGVCHAGYVTGFPVPSEVYSVALDAASCHAENVTGIAYTSYLATAPSVEPTEPSEPAVLGFDPANPSDIDLDLAVWAAYNAAARLTETNPEYRFIVDGDFETVRAAMAAEMEIEGLPGVVVEQAASQAEAHGCAPDGITVLRVAFTAGESGIVLVAASDRRQSSYYYEPSMTEIDVRVARECRTSGAGRTHTSNIR
jgi:hypothetical protein